MKKIMLSFLLLILFLTAATSQIPLRNVYVDVVVTQKNKTVSTDVYAIMFYDNAQIKPDSNSVALLASGYFIKLSFICDDLKEQEYIQRIFYNGAECALAFNVWNEKSYCNGIVSIVETISSGVVLVTVYGTTTIAKNYRQIRKL